MVTENKKNRIEAAAAKASEGRANRRTRPNFLEHRKEKIDQAASGRIRNKSIRRIEPEKCRVWDGNDRDWDLLDEERCADLIESIPAKGQEFPAIARILHDDPDGYEIEIICGTRRLWTVLYLRKVKLMKDLLLEVEIRDIDDEEAYRIQHVENFEREDINDLERAKSFKKALRRYYGDKIGLMAERMGMDNSTLGKYLKLAAWPDEMINAYPAVDQIKVYHAGVLAPLMVRSDAKQRIVATAGEIAEQQAKARAVGGVAPIAGPAVFKRLREAGETKPVGRKPRPREVLIKGFEKPVIIATKANAYHIVVPKAGVKDIDSLVKSVKGILGQKR